MRRERCTTGTGTRVPPRLTSFLFFLSEELHRQPRAVYEYWAGGCSASWSWRCLSYRSSTDSVTTPVVPVTLWDCACLSVVLASVFTAVRVGVRIRLYGLRLCSRSPWFWCSCVCARICRYGLVCAFTLRGPGARASVCRYADMGNDCVLALLVQWWCSSPSSVTAMWARIALSLSLVWCWCSSPSSVTATWARIALSLSLVWCSCSFLSWRRDSSLRLPVQLTIEIVQLQTIDKVFDVSVKTVESPQLQLVEAPGVDDDMPVVVQRQVLVST